MDWDDYKNFSKWEFDCKYTTKNEMQPQFMAVLQQIRNVWDKPISINSGYRHWSHPDEIEKNHRGEHTLGLAADIAIMGMDVFEFGTLAKLHGIKRIGIYQNDKKGYFMHLGMGDKAHDFQPHVWTR